MKLLSVFLCIALFLSSCSKKEKGDNEDLKLYTQAIENIKKRRFVSAQDKLTELENEYPYSDYAAKGEALNSFLKYVTKEYQEAYDLSDKFIKLRPANENSEYMYFLRSISLLELVKDRFRESDTAIKTQRSFRELNSRFPDSIYKTIAEQELAKLKNLIASHEMEIALFYQFNESYLPAILRYKKIIEEFPSSNYVAESHYRLVECFYSLGLIDEAKAQISKLQKDFPKTQWLAYANELKQDNVKKISD